MPPIVLTDMTKHAPKLALDSLADYRAYASVEALREWLLGVENE
jgi:hypothetical protein